MAKKQLSDVKVKEGALKKLGWPSFGPIAAKVENGSVEYKTVISRLNYLANITDDKATERKARAFIKRLQDRFQDKDKEK